MVTLALALLMLQTPQVSGERSLVSKCEVSTDAEYGYSKEKPIKVGGTPLYGAARQRTYLNALVGPAGQSVMFRRRGALPPNADGIILDAYEVKYDGLEKPVELYLDFYRWEAPKAPKGFLCDRVIALGEPPPVPRAGPGNTGEGPAPRPPLPPRAPAPPGGLPRSLPWNDVIAHAVETGTREELPPIPLDPYGSMKYGVAFDSYTRVARASRASGGAVPDDLKQGRAMAETLAVAFPITCGGVTATPKDITLVSNGRIMGRSAETYRGSALTRVLPAYAAPDESIGVLLSGSSLLPGDLTISYDRPPCESDKASVTLSIARELTRPPSVQPQWPAGVPESGEMVRVTLHALLDHEGNATEIKVVDGPEAFHAVAIAAVKAARHGQLLINGVPMRLPRPMATTVTFRPR